MKTKLTLIVIYLLIAICVPGFAQGTAFTYQGRLQNNGNPASGTYNLTFSLFNVSGGGSAVAGPVTTNGVFITNGLFSVTLDFGAGVFNGTTYWLQIGVETNGAGSFSTLSPRQQLTPAPYAVFAGNASASGLSGTIPSSSLNGTYGSVVNFNNGANSFDGSFYGAFYGSSFIGGDFVGTFIGSGSSLTDVWHTGGNSGTTAGVNFLGTTDNQPLELHVNGLRALRLEPTTNTSYVSGAVNVIQGSEANFALAGAHGATIAGGGADFYFGGNVENLVASDYGTIGGGVNNEIQTNAYESTIAGGNANWIYPGAYRSVIAGGWNNQIETNADTSVIGGGQGNIIGTNSPFDLVGGGILNDIQPNTAYSVLGGGAENAVGPNVSFSFLGGGVNNTNSASYAFLGGGINNFLPPFANYSFLGAGADNTDDAAYAFLGSGFGNSIQGGANSSVLGGGLGNSILSSAAHSFLGGGYSNSILPGVTESVIAGGYFNTNGSTYASIGGGFQNVVSGFASTIPGGYRNAASGSASFAAGQFAQATNNGVFVWSDTSGEFTGSTNDNSVTMRAVGGYRLFTSTGPAGAQLLANATSWTAISDRNAKKNIQPVDYQSVLEKLATVPVEQWNYEWEQDGDTPNIGPMAQDFKKAFYPGRGDKGISTLEFDGVELAAIQGLNEKVDARIQKLEAENADLKQRLATLEQIVLKQKSN